MSPSLHVAFIDSSSEGINKWPLFRAASAGSRPETNTAEQTTLAKPASPSSSEVPMGRYLSGRVSDWATTAGPHKTPASRVSTTARTERIKP